MTQIDPDRDFADFYRDGGDPDRDSSLLYDWHRSLWSREAAGAGPFAIEVVAGSGYELALTANDRSFRLASDSIVPTWSTQGWAHHFDQRTVDEIAADHDDFFRRSSTIGAYIVFPRNSAGQSGHTLNQARGVSAEIRDRFDLTLECIRRHYTDPGATNPLGERLAVYADFFALFADFDSYVSYFLLDDLLTLDGAAVRSLLTGDQIDGFPDQVLPTSAEQYAAYRARALDFVDARNTRILGLGL